MTSDYQPADISPSVNCDWEGCSKAMQHVVLKWNVLCRSVSQLLYSSASPNSDPGWFVSAFSFWELHLEVKYEGMERWLFTLFYISSTMMLILDIEGNCSRRRGKGAKLSRSCNSPERLAWEWPGSQGSNVLNLTRNSTDFWAFAILNCDVCFIGPLGSSVSHMPLLKNQWCF